MRRSLFPIFVFLFFLFFLACAPNHSEYIDRVKVLDSKMMSPKLNELFTHWTRADQPDDDLVRTWRAWLSDVGVPIVEQDIVTFVFYDFSHTVASVDLQANFMKGHLDAMERFGKTPLFYRVYKIAKISPLRYRFVLVQSDGTKQDVLDPFNPFAEPGSPPENKLPDLTVLESERNYISSAMEPGLRGRSLVLMLPPDYLRNFSLSYPVLYLVGMPEGPWDQPLSEAIQNQDLQPLIVVNVGEVGTMAPSDLANLLKTAIKPWVELHYRALSDKDNTILVGWGNAVSVVNAVAQGNRDTFGKIWTPSSDSNWGKQVLPVLTSLFPGAKP